MIKDNPPLGSREWREKFDRDFARADRVFRVALPLSILTSLVVLAGIVVGIVLLVKNFG